MTHALADACTCSCHAWCGPPLPAVAVAERALAAAEAVTADPYPFFTPADQLAVCADCGRTVPRPLYPGWDMDGEYAGQLRMVCQDCMRARINARRPYQLEEAP